MSHSSVRPSATDLADPDTADCACCDAKVAIFHCADECGLCCDLIKV